MIRRPPRSTRTDTLFPYTTLFRSLGRLSGQIGLKVGIPCQLAPRLGEKMDARGEAPCHQYRVAREDVPSAFSGYGDRADTQFARRAFDRNAAQNPEFGALGLPGRRGSAPDHRDRHALPPPAPPPPHGASTP